jgi:hypothetical protein
LKLNLNTPVKFFKPVLIEQTKTITVTGLKQLPEMLFKQFFALKSSLLIFFKTLTINTFVNGELILPDI